MSAIQRLGCIPDLPDHRDLRLTVPLQLAGLPSKIDLRKGMPAIRNQGALGACTAFAVGALLEYTDIEQGNKIDDPAELFIYRETRALEGNLNRDSGATLRGTLKTCATKGYPQSKAWPYVIADFKKKPPRAVHAEAKERALQALWHGRVSNRLREISACLADGNPIALGFPVPESFMSSKVRRTGVVEMPADDEAYEGGHAVALCGYDMGAERYLLRNSWGKGWGMQGYFTVPFAFIHKLAFDLWTVKRVAAQ